MKTEIVAFFLVIVVVSLAGCTDAAPLVTGIPAPPAPQVTMVVTASVIQSVTTVQVTATKSPARIFNGEYHWVEYRLKSSTTMPPNPRSSWLYNIKMERSAEVYNGSPANHYKTTIISDYPVLANDIVTIVKDGSISVEDLYFNPSTNSYLGGKYSETIKGVLQPPQDYSEFNSRHNQVDSPGGWLGFSPFCEMNVTLADLGTESVIVPAGSYPDARKYSGKFRDGTPITFWVAPGVPVPVRHEFPYKAMDGVDPFQSYELKGWG